MAILQVRDVPDDVMAKLRERAEAQGVSLSAYIRDILTDEARQPTMAEAIANIETLDRIDLTAEEILSAIHEGRR